MNGWQLSFSKECERKAISPIMGLGGNLGINSKPKKERKMKKAENSKFDKIHRKNSSLKCHVDSWSGELK